MRALGVVLMLAGAPLLAAPAPSAAPAGGAARAARALFFDGRYAEARTAWQAARPALRGADAQAALYWIARSSEKLGESERALSEYAAFLAAKPADRTLAEEARTSRVGLAAKLYKAGRRQHGAVLAEALADRSRTVRYYAALQAAGLGPEMGRAAIPVLRDIVKTEEDADLVGRAKLALLRIDPASLTGLPVPEADAPRAGGRRAGLIKVRITERGKAEPNVSLAMPFALAELVFKSLPADATRELRAKGYDADSFWRKLRDLGPTEVIDVEGEHGEKIRIWIE